MSNTNPPHWLTPNPEFTPFPERDFDYHLSNIPAMFPLAGDDFAFFRGFVNGIAGEDLNMLIAAARGWTEVGEWTAIATTSVDLITGKWQPEIAGFRPAGRNPSDSRYVEEIPSWTAFTLDSATLEIEIVDAGVAIRRFFDDSPENTQSEKSRQRVIFWHVSEPIKLVFDAADESIWRTSLCRAWLIFRAYGIVPADGH